MTAVYYRNAQIAIRNYYCNKLLFKIRAKIIRKIREIMKLSQVIKNYYFAYLTKDPNRSTL